MLTQHSAPLTTAQLFQNALSYTLAFNAVDRLASKQTTDLFFLSLAVAVAAILVSSVSNQWKRFAAKRPVFEDGQMVVVQCRDEGIQNLLDAVTFLLLMCKNIIVQLLSTLVARWVLTLPPQDSTPADVLPTAAISLVLVWLLARAMQTRAGHPK